MVFCMCVNDNANILLWENFSGGMAMEVRSDSDWCDVVVKQPHLKIGNQNGMDLFLSRSRCVYVCMCWLLCVENTKILWNETLSYQSLLTLSLFLFLCIAPPYHRHTHTHTLCIILGWILARAQGNFVSTYVLQMAVGSRHIVLSSEQERTTNMGEQKPATFTHTHAYERWASVSMQKQIQALWCIPLLWKSVCASFIYVKAASAVFRTAQFGVIRWFFQPPPLVCRSFCRFPIRNTYIYVHVRFCIFAMCTSYIPMCHSCV